MITPRARRICIACDSREQRPFKFSSGTPTVIKTLKHGDYSIIGMERKVCVERKSFDDLFYSFTKTRARMMDRLVELSELDAAALVMECTIGQVIVGHPRTSIVGSRLLGTLLVTCAQLGILALFCGGRHEAAIATESFLRAYANARPRTRVGGVAWFQRVTS